MADEEVKETKPAKVAAPSTGPGITVLAVIKTISSHLHAGADVTGKMTVEVSQSDVQKLQLATGLQGSLVKLTIQMADD